MMQLNRYAFSFDRETFRGDYQTRDAALAAGLEAARALDGAVEAVFVGKKIPLDPQADRHAEDVIRSMRRRMMEKTGEAAFLNNVNEQVLADLDEAIASAVRTWQKRHELEPQPRIGAVSEHPLPTVPQYVSLGAAHGEVHLIGPEA